MATTKTAAKAPETGGLVQAIINVMNEVAGVEKNLDVGKGRSAYKGVSDKDVKDTLRPAMARNGLVILPIGIEDDVKIDRWVENTQYGDKQKQNVFSKVITKYLLMHTSGESREIVGYGHGVDSQDKAAGKATTYALKYALLYTFLVSTGAIDDSDKTHSDEHETPKKVVPIKDKVVGINKHLNKSLTDTQLKACKDGFNAGGEKKDSVLKFLEGFVFTDKQWKFITGTDWSGGDKFPV